MFSFKYHCLTCTWAVRCAAVPVSEAEEAVFLGSAAARAVNDDESLRAVLSTLIAGAFQEEMNHISLGS